MLGTYRARQTCLASKNSNDTLYTIPTPRHAQHNQSGMWFIYTYLLWYIAPFQGHSQLYRSCSTGPYTVQRIAGSGLGARLNDTAVYYDVHCLSKPILQCTSPAGLTQIPLREEKGRGTEEGRGSASQRNCLSSLLRSTRSRNGVDSSLGRAAGRTCKGNQNHYRDADIR